MLSDASSFPELQLTARPGSAEIVHDVVPSRPAEQVPTHLRVKRQARAVLRQHQSVQVLLGLDLLLRQPQVPGRHR